VRVCASSTGSQAMEYLLTEDRILREVQTAVTDLPGPLSCGAQSSGDREQADNAAGKVGPDDRRFQSVAMDPVHERNVAASSRRQLGETRTDDANFLSARDIRSLEGFQQANRSTNTHLRSVRPHARSVVGTSKTPGKNGETGAQSEPNQAVILRSQLLADFGIQERFLRQPGCSDASCAAT
jgi:hypothetical protein